ncbi:DoxX family membrane protein [Candidatus Woesearchaeota archaeon]|nr:MAG: DoxX family membrane protein [Candidatus Woesearchaeota archaeon]
MSAETVLRIGLGIVLTAFGADQLRDWKPWSAYVPLWLRWALMPSEPSFWRAHATLNILLGVALFAGAYEKWIATLVSLWLATITTVTAFTDWHTSIRDLGLTAGAIALLLLSI